MGANSIQGQSDSEQCIAERKMVSDLSNRIDDLKVDLEWYKKVSWLKNKSYYDSFTNSLGGAGKPLSSPVVLADTEHRQVKVSCNHMKQCYRGYIAAKISSMKPQLAW